MSVFYLENTVQKYPWGSSGFLPALLGKENPTGEPWAEMWMGDHPSGPSIAIDPASGERLSLARRITGQPVAMLGKEVSRRFGPSLPFLFKVLSASHPLSIQVHPSKRKAERGYEREELAAIPRTSADRNYKDTNHKPETIVALGPFKGLCGFRPVEEILGNIRLLSPNGWRQLAGRLAERHGTLELSVFFYTVVSMKGPEKDALLAATRQRCSHILSTADPVTAEPFKVVSMLLDAYPGDIGALAPLAFNIFNLKPGQYLNISAGQPHAYLHGDGIEIMANSDNVLRGGLTGKHVDIPEFISALDFAARYLGPEDLPETAPGGIARRTQTNDTDPDAQAGMFRYHGHPEDYTLDRLTLDGGSMSMPRNDGPEIWLCTEGELTLEAAGKPPYTLTRGQSVYVSADEPGCTVSGSGQAFIAGVGV